MKGLVQSCRAASSGSRAVIHHRAAPSSVAKSRSAKRSELSELKTGIGNDVGSLVSGTESKVAAIFKGSSTGSSYAPTSPILSKVLGPKQESPVEPIASNRNSVRVATVKAKPNPVPCVVSEAELHQASVRKLRDMLAERGVPETSATEKADLVKWVVQHQHLPVLYSAQEGPKRRQTCRRSTSEGLGESHTREEREQKKQDEPDDCKRLEGEKNTLIEATERDEPKKRWPWIAGGIATTAAIFLGVALSRGRR